MTNSNKYIITFLSFVTVLLLYTFFNLNADKQDEKVTKGSFRFYLSQLGSEVSQKHKLAVIIPFRGVFNELMIIAPHLHRFLTTNSIDHKLIVINQADDYRFNKGSLINIGYLLSRNDCDYLAIQDIDTVPLNPELNYGYPEKGPFHVSSPKYHPMYHGKRFVGGIILLTNEQFVKINGMTNKDWGWGGEDNELYTRIIQHKYKLFRSEGLSTNSTNTFMNLHDIKKRPRDKERFDNEHLGGKIFKTDKSSGFGNTEYSIHSTIEMTISDAPVTVYNVLLSCNEKETPWCSADYHPE